MVEARSAASLTGIDEQSGKRVSNRQERAMAVWVAAYRDPFVECWEVAAVALVEDSSTISTWRPLQ